MTEVIAWNEANFWGVMDDTLRVRIGRSAASYLWIEVDIQMWSDRPTMGNLTSQDFNHYELDDLTLTDDGVLTALHRHPAGVNSRTSFTLRVPLSFVQPLRAALAAAQATGLT